MDGWRVGPRDILEKLEDPSQIDEVDPKTYSFRVNVHMETGDARYLHLNTGMWVASGVRRGTEGTSVEAFLVAARTDMISSQSSMTLIVSFEQPPKVEI